MSCFISPILNQVIKFNLLIIAVLVQSLRNINSKETRALYSIMSRPAFGPLQEACRLEKWRDGLLFISEATTKPVLMRTTENRPHQHSSISLSE